LRKKISASIITHHGRVVVVDKGAVVKFTRLIRLPFKMRPAVENKLKVLTKSCMEEIMGAEYFHFAPNFAFRKIF